MDKEYLRELAEEGAAIHSDPQPEREVCDGLLWALDEIERLREHAIVLAETARQVERERLATLQSMLREVGKWGFRDRSVAEEYDVLHGAGSWRRALRA